MAADINVLNNVMNTMTQASMSMKNNLIGEGTDLLLVLTVCMITYHLVLALLGNDWVDTQVSIFQTMLKWAIVMVMLTGWNSVVVDTFANKFNSIAKTATGNTTSIATLTNLGYDTIKKIFNAKASSNPAGTDTGTLYCDPMGSCVGEAVPGKPATTDGEASGFSIFQSLKLLTSHLAGFLLKLVAAFFVIMMLVAFVVVTFIGVFMLGVGVTVGPILIPFLVLPAMSYLFDGWLKFMITGGLIKVVAAIVIAIVGVSFTSLSNLAVDLNDASAMGVDFTVGAIMCLIAAISAYVMWQVPEFTAQLISGGGGTSASRFGKGAMGSATSKLLIPTKTK